MTALPARPSTKREQREASIERLLGAALSRFVGQGFSHTTVEQIADDAGLTKGSVYFYFKGKDALLMAVLDRVEQVVVDDMIARVSAAGPGAADKIVAFVHGQARLGVDRWEHVLLLILMSLEFAGRGGPVEDRTKAIYARMYRTIENVLELGRRQGVFRDDLRTREQAAIVMAGHDGTFLEWYRRGADFDGEELVRALRTATLGGLVETEHDPAGATAPATERRIG
jgi:AcrR family transcriptional regulator